MTSSVKSSAHIPTSYQQTVSSEPNSAFELIRKTSAVSERRFSLFQSRDEALFFRDRNNPYIIRAAMDLAPFNRKWRYEYELARHYLLKNDLDTASLVLKNADTTQKKIVQARAVTHELASNYFRALLDYINLQKLETNIDRLGEIACSIERTVTLLSKQERLKESELELLVKYGSPKRFFGSETPRDWSYMGDCYRLGLGGLPVNMKRAVALYRKAAEQGDSDAQFNLALRLDEGDGIPVNKKEAEMWYRKAAEQGGVGAQFNLAFMLDQGDGIPVNKKEAEIWFRKAAEQGEIAAQRKLALMLRKGDGIPVNKKEAEMWRKAAQQGDWAASRLEEKTREIRNQGTSSGYKCCGSAYG